jgi:hypothetical protein
MPEGKDAERVFYGPGLPRDELVLTLEDEPHQRRTLITAVNEGRKLYQLNPAFYRAVAVAEPDQEIIGLALRAILSQIQMRHTMATLIDLGDGKDPVRIGSNIPHYRVCTVELRMSRLQASVY